MRFIPTRIHAYLDYVFGALLIVAPWVLGFANGGPEQWTPVVIGVVGLAYTLMTDHELGASPMISMPVHLGLDVALGLFLLLSPWLLNFAHVIAWPHVLVGALIVVAGLTTRTVREDVATPRI
jgi:hypothetical protein